MKDELLARPMVSRSKHDEAKSKNPDVPKPRVLAGHKEIGETRPALVIARGALTQNQPHPKRRVYGLESALSESSKTI
jgi:hypothetical protein